MWAGNSGSWPQGQWPLQQSAYQNIPHEQVDWAALAQQWIQMKEAMNDTCDSQQPPQVHCPPSRPPLQQPQPQIPNRPLLPRPPGGPPLADGGSYGPQHAPERNIPPSQGPFMDPNERETESGGPYDNSDSNWTPGNSGYWQSPSWNAAPPNWVPPHAADNRDPPFEFGRNHGNQGFGAQTYNYNHGSDEFYFNQTGEPSSYNQYWTQSSSVQPPFVRGNMKDRLVRGESPLPAEEETAAPFNLDAVKCKNLPAWIREGLEKMDRDKQKKLDRERMLQEREERLRRQQEEEEQVLKDIQTAKDKATSFQIRKSKFESDSEEDGDSPDVRLHSPAGRRSISPKRTPSPIITPKTEQEKLEEMMLLVRRTLTEILLTVTNEEVIAIAKEIFNRERIKAPAHQLSKSSALASITGKLGLGDYGSDSETSEGEQERGEDSDAELQENIQRRKAEFAEREKQIAAAFRNDLSGDETDEDRRKGATRIPERSKADVAFISSINSDSGRERYHFEKKYLEIPGLGNQDDDSKKEASSGLSSRPSGTSGVEDVKGSSTENSHSTRSQSRSNSASSTDSSRKRKRSSSKERHARSSSDSGSRSQSRSRSRSPRRIRKNSKRDSSDVEEKPSRRSSESGKNGRAKDRRKRSRSVSRERRYRRPSDNRSSRKSRSRSRDRRRNSYNSGRRRQRSKSRSRSYDRSHYRRDSRKYSRSRSTSSESDHSRSRERRNSRRSHSRSPPSKREGNWSSVSRAGKK